MSSASEFNPVCNFFVFFAEDKFDGVTAVVRAVYALMQLLNCRINPHDCYPKV